MAIHNKDRISTNPRIQCSVCGQWKRLHGVDEKGYAIQRFYGGCRATKGDHIAGNKIDVCDECCKKHCKFNPAKK